jgi:hypothetical protein
MRIYRSVLVCCGAMLLVGAAAAARSSSRADRLTYLTFSGAVGLPGVILASGTYAFEVANPTSSGDVVMVRNRERTRVYFLGFTQRIDRPAGLPANRFVTLGEAPRGTPMPITAWFPDGEASGYQFLYGAH